MIPTEVKRSFENAYRDLEPKLVGTAMCPYQFTCEAVSEDAEIARASDRESTEVAIILAGEIMDLREHRTYEFALVIRYRLVRCHGFLPPCTSVHTRVKKRPYAAGRAFGGGGGAMPPALAATRRDLPQAPLRATPTPPCAA